MSFKTDQDGRLCVRCMLGDVATDHISALKHQTHPDQHVQKQNNTHF